MKNSIDTAREEGEIKGKIEGKTEIAKNLKNKGFALTEIAEITGLAKEDIEGI